jgi:endonuclease G, mitochondrial
MKILFHNAHSSHSPKTEKPKKALSKFARVLLALTIQIFWGMTGYGQTYFNMSTGNYTESFTSWTTPSTNSFSSVATSTGTVPNATVATTASVNFTTGTSGGIQNGATNIQFLSTGATDNSSAVALDLNLNFTNRNAGTITFDATTVFNSTGNRAGSLKIYYSTNASTWTELTGTNLPYTANNNTAKSANISVPLPTALNNQATVKIRFYYHNGGPALASPTGSRPKIALDNLTVTSTSQGISLTASPSNLSNLDYFTGSGPSVAQSYNLNGSLLSSNITITAPTNFEISTSPNTGYTNSITFTPSEPLNNTYYVRLIAGLTPSTYTGAITHSGGGIATTLTVTVSGTVADIVPPTQLAIVYLTPTSPNINTNFSATIQAQDNTGTAQNVATATSVTVSLNTGTGVLSGTVTGTIAAGSNSVTITGIQYNVAETNVIITATRTAGDVLTNANSAPFTVIDNTLPTEIKSIATGNWNATTTWDCACVPSLTDNVRIKVPHTVTVIPSTTEQGCAKIFVEVGATLHIQTPNFKMGYSIQSTSIHLTMGNPSNATTTISNPDNYLLEKPQYVLSYNRTQGKSNWVSWYLSSASIGSTPRQNDFRPDPSLPSGWYQVLNTDYTGSGFDRGHMTPSGDRTASIPDNSATFLMTNMIPQAPDNNQGPWEGLESYLRGQLNANGGQEIYIISGSYGIGGTGSTGGITNTIAGGKVTVPSQTYKIAVILPVGTDDINRVSTTTRVIAIIMPNTQGIRTNDWRIYRTSVDAIEAATGYNFLANIPTAIQDSLEAAVDTIPN